MATGTITGTFKYADGSPIFGRVSFYPETAGPVLNANSDVVVPTTPKEFALDANGSFTAVLTATDDPTLIPSGFTYRYSYDLNGNRGSFSITVPAGTTRDIADISPVTAASGSTPAFGPQMVTFSLPGPASVTTGTARLYNDSGGMRTLTQVRVSVGTPPSGSSLVVDVLKGGESIYTTTPKPTVSAGQNTGTARPNVTTWASGEYLTVDVTAVGSSAAGSNLTATISYN